MRDVGATARPLTARPLAATPLTAEAFFGAGWTGRGEVSLLFGRILRSFDVTYRPLPSGEDGVMLCEETVVYAHGAALDRSWHLSREGDGLLGLEPLQGGRMRIADTRRGFRIRYDRLRLTPGRNVTRLSVEAWRDAAGQVHIQGWTRVLGVVPLFRTRVVLAPLAPDGGLRPASS